MARWALLREEVSGGGNMGARTLVDVLEEVADGYQGPLKVQVCGPWTLLASLELPASLDAVDVVEDPTDLRT